VSVTVTPAEFTLVAYDGARIRQLVAEVADRLGLPADLLITVSVDERTPLARARLTSLDPPVLEIEGGAFEAVRHPRQLNEDAVVVTAARLLGRVSDRRDSAFSAGGAPPPEEQLTLAQADVWDAYCLGRAERLGYATQQPRWRYRFRTRHGFSDVADRVFDRLWMAEHLTWTDLDAACAETGATGATGGAGAVGAAGAVPA
jgi:hypothetical protein